MLLEKRASAPSNRQNEVENFGSKNGYNLPAALKQLVSGGAITGVFKEMNDELEKTHGPRRSPNSILIPINNAFQRDVTVANAASVGNLQHTELSMTPIEALYNDLILVRSGASFMPGLVGNIDVPRFNNVISAQYVAENGAATDSSLNSDLVELRAKTLSANIAISRSIQQQTAYNVQALSIDHLREALIHKMDLDSLIGSGASNTVRGVLNQTGIGSLTSGGTLTWQDILDMEAEVKSKNALISKGFYITTSKIESKLKGTQRANGLGFIMENGKANNYDVLTTNGIPEVGTTTKTSTILFGDGRQIMVGTWGVLELILDPYTQSTKGQSVITAFLSYDVAVKRPQAFCAISDVNV